MCRSYYIVFISLVFLVIESVFLSRHAAAFDAGHHLDQNRYVLKKEGFSEAAIDAVSLANWLADYYATAPAVDPSVRPGLARLQFDNLPDSQSAENYFAWYAYNSKKLIQEAAQNNDRIQLLATMGLVLHALQDFYSHTNWTTLYPRYEDGSFNKKTYPSSPVPTGKQLFSGTWPPKGDRVHGGYFDGLNQDSIVRPKWAEAQVSAIIGTSDMVATIRKWVNEIRPDLWRRTAEIKFNRIHKRQIARDLRSALQISMYVKATVLGLPAQDGHWKGNLSGDASKFSAAVTGFGGWQNSFMTQYFRRSGIVRKLALNLFSDTKPPEEIAIENANSPKGAIVVRIENFNPLNNNGKFDRYRADMIINGQKYMGRELESVSGQDKGATPLWMELHPLETLENNVDFSISLVGIKGNTETPINLSFNNEQRLLQLSLSPISGNLSGSINKNSVNSANLIRSAGTGDEPSGEIIFSVGIHEIR